MHHDITITEPDRQVLLQGLAYLAYERPTWDRRARAIAAKLHGIPVLEAFLVLRTNQQRARKEAQTP